MRECAILQASRSRLLKKDLFGRSDLVETDQGPMVRRDSGEAALLLRLVARRLLAREARALAILENLDGIPELHHVSATVLERHFVDGRPMQDGKPTDLAYFHAASKLLRQLHRHGVAHNDLAKEPNFLVTRSGKPVIIDFQLSSYAPRRGRLFRLLAREDIRHLLKHKRTYCPEHLTTREIGILQNPTLLSRLWMKTGKPVYLFVTRRLLGWKDREGAGDRV
jgi:RIO-like serine/threonine protein kinase